MKGKLLTIFDLTYKMSSLTRFSQTNLMKDESVLEHTGFVVLLCYLIALRLKEENIHLDMGILLSKAASHDVDEIITGDVPRPTKYYNEAIKNIMKEIEEQNMKEISQNIHAPDLYVDWKFSKEGKEGVIVALCDALAIVYKAYYECVMMGNKTITNHVMTTHRYLVKLENRFKKEKIKSEFIEGIIIEAKNLCDEIQIKGEI